MSDQSETYVALIRGINVGGNSMVRMKDLKNLFEDLGYGNVQTYINSGNVIFTSGSNPRQLEDEIEKALETKYSKSIRALVRSQDEIKKAVDSLPKNWQHRERKCDVMFLSPEIDSPKVLKELQPQKGLDELHYIPGVMLWSIKIQDFNKSNVRKIIGSKLHQEMTIRGPNTVHKLYELMTKV